jgi:hypothetical protein
MINSKSVLSVFKATPIPTLVLLTDSPLFTVACVNSAFLKENDMKENNIVGKSIFEVVQTLYTENEGTADLHRSLEKVVSSKTSDKMPVQSILNERGKQERRYHQLENIPVLSKNDEIEYILHTSADVTEKENALRDLRSNEKKTAGHSTNCKNRILEIRSAYT